MRKVFVLLCVSILMACLGACGANETTSQPESIENEENSAQLAPDYLSSQTQGGYLVSSGDTAYLALGDQLLTLDSEGNVSNSDTITLPEEAQLEMDHLALYEDRLYFRNGIDGKLYCYSFLSGDVERMPNTVSYSWNLIWNEKLYYSGLGRATQIFSQDLDADALPLADEGLLVEEVSSRPNTRCPTPDGLYYVNAEDNCLWFFDYTSGASTVCSSKEALSPVADTSGLVYYKDKSGNCYCLQDENQVLFHNVEQLFAAKDGYLWYRTSDGNLAVWSTESASVVETYGIDVLMFQTAGQWYYYRDIGSGEDHFGLLSAQGTIITQESYAIE
jgi:hypothetical protein